MNCPVPKDCLEEIREIKERTGKTIMRIIADALRFSLREENKKHWL